MICLPLHEARNRLTAIVREAEEGAFVRLTRHGKPVAVLLGMDTLSRLESSGNGFARRYERFLKAWPSGDMDGSRLEDAGGDASSEDDTFQGLRSAEPGRIVDL